MTIHDLAVTTTKLLSQAGGPMGPGGPLGAAGDSTEALHHHITMHHHHQAMLPRSRFMITDILANNNNNSTSDNNNGLLSRTARSPCSSPASVSSDGPRDLSLHGRDPDRVPDPHGDDGDLSDDHEESGTDSGLPGETSSVCSNGEYLPTTTLIAGPRSGGTRTMAAGTPCCRPPARRPSRPDVRWTMR